MMNETERAKVREHFKNHPDATAADIGHLLGRGMDTLEIIEAGLIMIDVEEHAEAEAAKPAEAPETKTTARCRLEIEFSVEQNDRGYACNVKMSIPPGTEENALGLVLRRAVKRINDELAKAMSDGDMLKRAFDGAEREVLNGTKQ